MTSHRIFLALLAAPACFAAVLAACSDDASAPAPHTDAGTTFDSGEPIDAAPLPDASTAVTPVVSTITRFDAAQYELAEGLTTRDGKAYVAFAPLGEIVAIDQAGVRTHYASVPPGGNNGYTLGLRFDAAGDLFVLKSVNVPDAGAPTAGVYKIPAGTDGGVVAAPFATHPSFAFPNGLDLDAAGNLFVADSAAGMIFKVDPAGTTTVWSSDPELGGSPACSAPLPFPIGANGIVVTASDVFVTNTAKGSLLRLPVKPDGSAAAAAIIVKDCANVGFDGLTLDADGTFLVAQNGAPGRIVRVTAAGVVTSLTPDATLLDGPASIAIVDSWGGKRAAIATNSAFFSVGVDGGAPKPSLVELAPLP